jgi:hypothetical protein
MRLLLVIVLAIATPACSVVRYSANKPCKHTPLGVDLTIMGASLIPLMYGIIANDDLVAAGSGVAFLVFGLSAIVGAVKIMPPPGYRRVCS